MRDAETLYSQVSTPTLMTHGYPSYKESGANKHNGIAWMEDTWELGLTKL